MKASSLLSALMGVALAIPAPENAQHHHAHKRDLAYTTSTFVVYVTDEGGETSTTAIPESSTSTLVPSLTASSTSSSASATKSFSSSSSSTSSVSSISSTSSSGGVDGDLYEFSNPAEKFEDGVHSCDSVPTGNGVISLDWVGLSGWASILNENGDSTTSCKEGYYCSYACQAGMSKTQWPSSQLSDGQTRGGLVCENGKLHRTNIDNDYLCEWGEKTAYAVNKLNKVVSLCRTDYPGSENMVVPTRLTAGSTKPMSVVNSGSYFKWKGKPTSSQYYINDAGVDIEEGCVWGTEDGTIGNWAPVVAGAGKTGSITYLSLIPNPNNKTPPNYSIKIEANGDSTAIGDCVYADGHYNGKGTDGCTVSVISGSANFVFY